MTVEISSATVTDAQALHTLRSDVAAEMMRRFGAGEWSLRPGLATVERQLRASRVLLGREDATLVGTVRLAVALQSAFDASAFTPAARALYVLGLAVSPAARGRGIGRALMEAAKEVARAAPVDALWLDAYEHAAGAGPFYLKCGFRRALGATRHSRSLAFYEWRVDADTLMVSSARGHPQP